ncbi:hypothetical protein GLOTRDRAFT_96808 [Gloeophyllum trabeum ATCC 11539]|uniref:Uncharacterized protein n=1 Tax=Gloeophyllum trabeum (strain ATCC 11539 / FP-39264 / Madison 617) TaxID=670483 RepID=S7PSW1_GLOTA|nr:uncharacterized protein GLOTRDRAFT_96808 [Gloeophyllum trabeum ATCC 11539]EPQ50896.1 hypothetical protein GLOTRDRAFT_96808 [Gloeophyllum trabeum ATCC 11539]
MIFEAIEDYNDIGCLCVTNATLWTIGYKHCRRMLQRLTSWQQDRILCLGDESWDVPDGLLTHEEGQEVQEYAISRSSYDDPDCVELSFVAVDLYEQEGLSDMRSISQGISGPHGLRRYLEQEALRLLFKPVYFHDKLWVLCNLSKREFPHLLVKPLLPDKNIHRGVWAGDQFTIVMAEELEERFGDEEPWKDVSEEIVKD